MYVVEVRRSAQKQLDRLPRQVQTAIYLMLADLANDPRPIGVTKMAGTTNRYRIRSGDYWIVYDIFDDTGAVEVAGIEHRKVVCRHLSVLLWLPRTHR